MNRFFRLLRKELEAMGWSTGVFVGIMGVIMVAVRLKIEFPQYVPALTVVLPLAALPFWLLWQSVQSLRTEWREDTVYTLLSLPVPGWWITLAKLMRIWIEYTLILALIALGNLVLFLDVFRVLLGDTDRQRLLVYAILLYLLGLALIAIFVTITQLALVVSKMVGRLQGLVALWTGLIAFWLLGVISRLLQPLFVWLPPISLQRLLRFDKISEVEMDLQLALRVDILLAVAALFILAAYLLEHFVEIKG